MQFKVAIKGIVQGVGFRPFVYRTAKRYEIKGYIKNSGNSVELLIQGKEKNLTQFLNILKNNAPPLSRITDIEIIPCNTKSYSDFFILKSERDGESDSVIPPDISICKRCLGEMLDKKNRRYLYPFTVCTDCGPRFTIIESLPYDRENTTMANFRMCKLCKKEYLNPLERRFRAEPICCQECGPRYELYRRKQNMHSNSPIKDVAIAIQHGEIVAIKGIGGTHLCCAIHDDTIMKMRSILKRPNKPFAVMARNLSESHKIAFISEKEEKLLLSPQRPIVILKKKNLLSEYISPGLDSIGIMLPYSGVHYLLFHYSKLPAFVMTSANMPGEPMAIHNEDILSIEADVSLIHNRRIKNRCDDSVIKVINNNATFLRRSRGFVPIPIEVMSTNKTVLSLGAELEVTACILKDDKAFLTQYIGNTTKLKTLEYLESAIYNLMELTGIDKPEAIAVDMHPSFNTTTLGMELSRKFDIPLIRCQHHFAHAASLMAESNQKPMVCIVADGVGYGNDYTIWGGEIIVVDEGFERAGSLMPQLMPGADLASKYPARMAIGILSRKYDQKELWKMFQPYFSKNELAVILKQIETRFNTPITSSTGRILDSIAGLLNVCTQRTYEGEPAMKLEAFAAKGNKCVEIPILITKKDGRYMLDTTEIVDAVYNARNKHRFQDIAASSQSAIARGLSYMAIEVAKDRGIKVIGFSGGVAYNNAIITEAQNTVEKEGFEFVTHVKLPCGDGGISLGQAVIATIN